jgi:glycosyltransferase involved in cell wall biosynthesis
MKVVYDLRILEPKMHGMARYALELLGAMLALDKDMRIGALIPGPEVIPNLPGDERLTLWQCALPPYGPKSQFALPKLLAKLEPDIYHCPFFGPPVGYDGPMLITLHDLIHVKFARDYGLRQKLYYRYVVGPAARKARRVFTVSQQSKKDLVELLGVTPKKVVVTYNGVAPGFKPLDPQARPAVRRELGLPPAYILGVGNPKPHKNLAALIKAHGILREAGPGREIPSLVLVGVKRGDLPGDAQVHFLSHLDDQGLIKAYGAAEMVVVPSLYEGFGLPALEAMACAAPVIVSDRASLPEVVGKAGLVSDPSPPALAAAMGSMLADKELRTRLTRAGLKQAARFSWERVARETLDTYREVVAEGGKV